MKIHNLDGKIKMFGFRARFSRYWLDHLYRLKTNPIVACDMNSGVIDGDGGVDGGGDMSSNSAGGSSVDRIKNIYGDMVLRPFTLMI